MEKLYCNNLVYSCFLIELSKYLNIYDLIKLMMVSKTWFNSIARNNHIWLVLIRFLKYYNSDFNYENMYNSLVDYFGYDLKTNKYCNNYYYLNLANNLYKSNNKPWLEYTIYFSNNFIEDNLDEYFFNLIYVLNLQVYTYSVYLTPKYNIEDFTFLKKNYIDFIKNNEITLSLFEFYILTIMDRLKLLIKQINIYLKNVTNLPISKIFININEDNNFGLAIFNKNLKKNYVVCSQKIHYMIDEINKPFCVWIIRYDATISNITTSPSLYSYRILVLVKKIKVNKHGQIKFIDEEYCTHIYDSHHISTFNKLTLSTDLLDALIPYQYM